MVEIAHFLEILVTNSNDDDRKRNGLAGCDDSVDGSIEIGDDAIG